MKFSDQLLSMIRLGENEIVELTIEQYQLYNSVDRNQTTLLHYASKFGNERITRYLLGKGCPIDSQDWIGRTPLMMAVKRNREEVIKVLLRAGANLSIICKENRSVVFFLARQHSLSINVCQMILQEWKKTCSTSYEIGKKMIEAGCHVYQAVGSGDAIAIKYMLDQGRSSNSMNLHDKLTALHTAVTLGNVKIVKLLLQYGADVNAIDIRGVNPLGYLCQNSELKTCERLEILQMLIDAGVSMTSCTVSGIFQVAYVLVEGNQEVIRMILQSNIDFTIAAKFQGRCILHNLAMNRNPRVTEELKHYVSKFNVNAVDQQNMSPLFYAVIHANVDMVKFLLEQGSETNIAQCTYGFTPLYYAYAKSKVGLDGEHYGTQYDECAELLLQYNADLQYIATRKSGEQVTIFDVALRTNNPHKIKSVIAHLAMREALGTAINEISYSSINLHEDLKIYLNECRQVLQKKVLGSITVLKLLTSNKKKIVSYLRRKQSVFKLKRLSYDSKAIFLYSHYHSILRKSLSAGMHHKRFRNKASDIISKILPNHFGKTHFFTDKMIDYFNDEDLRQLYQF